MEEHQKYETIILVESGLGCARLIKAAIKTSVARGSSYEKRKLNRWVALNSPIPQHFADVYEYDEETVRAKILINNE